MPESTDTSSFGAPCPDLEAQPEAAASHPLPRGRGRPRKTLPPVAKPKMPKGRPVGYRVPTFADLDELTVEDFSFVRGVINGMTPHEAFTRFYRNIHFDARGNSVVPHGLTLNARFAELERRIAFAGAAADDKRLNAAAEAVAMALPQEAGVQAKRDINEIYNAWFDNLDPDVYGEAELPLRFQEYLVANGIEVKQALSSEVSRAVMIDRKVKAINELQTALAYRPRLSSATSIWLAAPLSRVLSRMEIADLGMLMRFIERTGRNWHRKIPRLGPVRAMRLQAWIEDHADTLGRLATTGQQWAPYAPLKSALKPLERAVDVMELVPQPDGRLALPSPAIAGSSVAPLELLVVPSHLDGISGTFRSVTANHLGASRDIDAVAVWLGSFRAANKMRTLEAYRREAERFLIWCYAVANVAMSSVSVSHAMQYQIFLKRIPPQFISEARVTREDPSWRPWRGQLSPRSQAYALTVMKLMFQAMVNTGYLTGNPFSSLKSEATVDRAMDTSRSLDRGDLEWVRGLLAQRNETAFGADEQQPPAAISGASLCPTLTQVRTRRIELILNLLLTTGLRLEEVATASLTGMAPAQVDGQSARGEYALRIVGKGKKSRTIYIPAVVHDLIEAHHNDLERLIVAADGSNSPRLLSFQLERPLVASLGGLANNTKVTELNTGKRRFGLGKHGIYKTLKAFLRTAAGRDLRTAQRAYQKLKVELARATKVGDTLAVVRLNVEIKRLEQDAALAMRRMSFSTHWMRHTFAKEVLRHNPDGAGLKHAQQALGHASIATTGMYLKQDMSSMVKALRKVNPLGRP